MKLKFWILLILFLPIFCIGEEKNGCSEDILKLIRTKLNYPTLAYRQYKYDSYSDGEQIISGVCKIWPKDITKTIVAIAYYDQGHVEDIENSFEDKNYILVIVNSDASRFISILQWKNNFDLDGLSIDTGRYDVANGIRAFGLDISERYHPHTVSGGSGSKRTLFIQEGEIIRPVLKDFLLSEWQFVVEPMFSTWHGGNKSIQRNSYTISVGKNVTNGFKDLEITKSTTYEPDPSIEEKIDLPKNESKLFKVLHFNGKEYQ